MHVIGNCDPLFQRGAAGEMGERRGALATQNLAYFDGVLNHQAFLAGDNYSVADSTLFAALLFARHTRLPISNDLSALSEWFIRFSDIPAVKNRTGQHL